MSRFFVRFDQRSISKFRPCSGIGFTIGYFYVNAAYTNTMEAVGKTCMIGQISNFYIPKPGSQFVAVVLSNSWLQEQNEKKQKQTNPKHKARGVMIFSLPAPMILKICDILIKI